MTGLVIRNKLLSFVGEGCTLLLETYLYAVHGIVNILLVDHFLLLSGCKDSCLVHNVGQISSGHAKTTLGDFIEIDVVSKGFALGMHSQDSCSSLEVRQSNLNLSVKATGTKQSLVKNIRDVSRSQYNDTSVALETVHLCEHLVDSLLTLIVTHADTLGSLSTDGIELIDEDDAGSVLFGLGEEVADSGGADTNKHFDELSGRDRDEGNTGLASNSLSE